jgi:SAM-dependent methyltransferase
MGIVQWRIFASPTEETAVSWPSRLLSFAFSKDRSAESSAAAPDASAAEIFSRVYRNNLWGRRRGQKFCSGPGSYDEAVVGPYVESVREFLAALPRPPHVVDLGCGDFQVGRRLRQACGGYVACDVVPELIRYNTNAFARQQVDFMCLNIIEDELPDGEVVFVRQVLQHLSNEQIARVLPKLTRYRFVIVTEHLPGDPTFVPNLDHGLGSGIRVTRNSGVVLTAPPFNFKVASERHLCSVRYGADVIKSVAYGI